MLLIRLLSIPLLFLSTLNLFAYNNKESYIISALRIVSNENSVASENSFTVVNPKFIRVNRGFSLSHMDEQKKLVHAFYPVLKDSETAKLICRFFGSTSSLLSKNTSFMVLGLGYSKMLNFYGPYYKIGFYQPEYADEIEVYSSVTCEGLHNNDRYPSNILGIGTNVKTEGLIPRTIIK
jgi:hypothetical protein